MGLGVPAGTTTPCMNAASRPDTPASAKVGTSGSRDDRFPLVTASARNLPAVTCGTAVADDDIDFEVFLDDPHHVVAGSKSPWARRNTLSLAELIDEPWVFPEGQVVRGIIAEAFRAHGLAMPRERVTSGTLHMQHHLLATGHFLTVTASSVLRYNAKEWSLKALPVDLRVKPRPHAIVTLKNRILSPVVKLFIDELKTVARAQPQLTTATRANSSTDKRRSGR